jgi:hypothetical protein
MILRTLTFSSMHMNKESEVGVSLAGAHAFITASFSTSANVADEMRMYVSRAHVVQHFPDTGVGRKRWRETRIVVETAGTLLLSN